MRPTSASCQVAGVCEEELPQRDLPQLASCLQRGPDDVCCDNQLAVVEEIGRGKGFI